MPSGAHLASAHARDPDRVVRRLAERFTIGLVERHHPGGQVAGLRGQGAAGLDELGEVALLLLTPPGHRGG
jgi:hypothetical protein